MDIQVRLAAPADMAAVNEIYNYYVRTSTCTYQDEITTDKERAAWFTAHGERHPVTVALLEGIIVGWAALSRFHDRSAYRFTVENSVYVRHDFQRRGIGRTLLADLLARADALGHRSVIALISADQAPSVALHQAAGFVTCGVLRDVGFKFERWLDVIYMQWTPERCRPTTDALKGPARLTA